MQCKIVFVSGTWDLFHIGHLRRLQNAKTLGDLLVVGVVTDDFVITYKDRPIIPYWQRWEIVHELKCVDIVVPHFTADDTSIIQNYKVDVRVVGPEFGQLEGQKKFLEWAKENGVEVVVLPRTPNISTTIIKEAIRERETVRNVVGSSVGGANNSSDLAHPEIAQS